MRAPALQHTSNGSVCVVGGGSIGSMHIELHENAISVERVGVVEVDAELRASYANKGFRTHATLEEAIEYGYALYDICLPTFLHFDAITQILRGTKANVICEKPLVLDYEQFNALYQMPEDVKARIVCAFVERFNDPFIKAKEWTAAHKGPYTMHFVRRTKKPIRQDWVKDPSKGGSILLDLAIHDIEASLWFSGASLEKVESRTTGNDSEHVTVLLSDGSTVYYEAGWDIPEQSNVGIINTFRVEAIDGIVAYDSALEQITIDSDTVGVVARYPSAYEAELVAARSMTEQGISRYPSFVEMRELYRILDQLLKKGK